MTQLVHLPTRDDHILDLIFTNHPNSIFSVQIVDNIPGTDHDAVEFVVLSSIVGAQPNRVLYNYTKADFNVFLEVLSHVPWDCVPFDSGIEYAWACWKDLFFSVVSATIPTVKWRQSKMKHWFSSETIHLIRVKRRIYRQMKRCGTDLLKRKYKAISNLVRSQTRKDTAAHVSNLSSSYFVNSKKFWNFLNSVKGRRHPVPPLKHNDTLISDDYDKALIFNRYFHSVFTVERSDNLSNLRQSLEYHPDLIDTINFSVEEVHTELLNLRRGKACGPDHISAHLLQKGADLLASPLTKLFQLSLSTGTLPNDWVTANIVPVYKKGDKHLSSNYRPISLTSVVVKVMERIIHRQLTTVLESNHLISNYQHGFRRQRSTVTLLLTAVHDWAACLERRHSVHCIFLDLAKAFDSVPHTRLLLKLECLGIRGNLLSWLDHFLTKRFQRVVINGTFSGWLPVLSGVPQGSVLGPLLFLLYVDDIYRCVSYSSVQMFADDIALYREIVLPSDQELLQEDLNQVYAWSCKWLLNLNPSKCDSICISYKHSPPSAQYWLGGQQLSTKSTIRYLGIYINSHLKWNDHVKCVTAKSSRTLNHLRHALYTCPSSVKAAVYRCIVRPLLEYASPVWYLYSPGDIKKLEAVQRRAARWVCGSRWNASRQCWSRTSDSCLDQLKWPSLHSRQKYFTICQLHSIFNNYSAISFKEYFSMTNRHSCSNAFLIDTPISTINPFRYSFFINSPFLWNSVPARILQISHTKLFRSALRRFLL